MSEAKLYQIYNSSGEKVVVAENRRQAMTYQGGEWFAERISYLPGANGVRYKYLLAPEYPIAEEADRP